mgnify:CR=1 FL=1
MTCGIRPHDPPVSPPFRAAGAGRVMPEGDTVTEQEIIEMIKLADHDGDTNLNYEEYVKIMLKK